VLIYQVNHYSQNNCYYISFNNLWFINGLNVSFNYYILQITTLLNLRVHWAANKNSFPHMYLYYWLSVMVSTHDKIDRYDHIGMCSRLIQCTTPTSVLMNKFHMSGNINDQWKADNWVKDWVWRGMCISVKMLSYLSILSCNKP